MEALQIAASDNRAPQATALNSIPKPSHADRRHHSEGHDTNPNADADAAPIAPVQYFCIRLQPLPLTDLWSKLWSDIVSESISTQRVSSWVLGCRA